ncbi:presenilin family intramembrane aspartyl protease PSH [Haloplanus pelagicus]|jgi:presenilin-like A22 family membrane protease|uniref:presenilin family intramembrane aspartyl protease PSH n=1 Tax=Haloplanus pelagicus TaxID=2949995 RepID=UPI00203D209A|nr:presenilin family intramembrane aspartyl protease PSH [Haloplanus sp. HW8-1]
MNAREARGVAVAATLFLLVQVGALAMVGPFETAGYQAVEDPSDPTNSLVYFVAILVATGAMLAAFKYAFERAVRAVVVLSSALVSWYVFGVVAPPLLVVGAVNVLAVALSIGVAVALLVYPEWYVIDGAGVVMGIGAGALFGISFGLLPAIVLLSVLAVYDAISVYGTRHMLSLAEGVMDLRVPVILVVPLSLSYSLLADDFEGANEVHEDADAAADGDGEEGTDTDGDREGDAETAVADADRDAFFIGLGDAVMPTVMVASGAFFSPAPSLGVAALPALNFPALLAMVGTFLGLGVLLWAVMKGRAHAGLPLLNGGAIGGYLLGSVLAGVPVVRALGLAPYL